MESIATTPAARGLGALTKTKGKSQPKSQPLTPVEISHDGVVRNILSLNYTRQTTVKEYLNNTLDKNSDQRDYSVNFNMRDFGDPSDTFMFEYTETDSVGFADLNELVKAFCIADSERKGTNNMGYGIYAPITMTKGHDAWGLFIQDNEKGRFYSAVHFDATHNLITSVQGNLEDIEASLYGSDLLDIDRGTNFVWITHRPTTGDGGSTTHSTREVVKKVSQNYRKSQALPPVNSSSEWDDEIKELGKYYCDHLNRGVNINYQGVLLEEIDILRPESGTTRLEKVFQISHVPELKDKGHRIQDECGTWCGFNKSKSYAGKPALRGSHRVTQSATIRIIDLQPPSGSDVADGQKKKRMTDRKVWVKMGDTYIFKQDFSLKGWPNLRVILELNDEGGDNSFDSFISPDANKSNSQINESIKQRIECLVKCVTSGWSTTGPKVTPEKKHRCWETCIGEKIRGKCGGQFCGETIDVWNYVAVKGAMFPNNTQVPGEAGLICVCKDCAKT
jgi:hypothetical protein